MPYFWISEPQLQLRLQDFPLGTYSPGLGPSPVYSLSYRNKGSTPEDTNYFSFGTNWSCSLREYVFDLGGGVTRMHRGGAGFVDYPNGVTQFREGSVMQVINPGVSYELDLPDGSKKLYQTTCTNSYGDVMLFITQRVDPQGNAVTYNYSTNGGILQLVSIKDADMHSTSLYYENSTFPNRVTKVVDPFNRTNKLIYNNLGYITNITDCQGLVSSFRYDADVSVTHTGWITNMTTPYGTTSFTFGGSEPDTDGYAQSDHRVNRYIQVTLPNGGNELYAYRAKCDDFIPQTYASVPSTSPLGNTLDNVDQYNRNSFYWSPLQYSHLSTNDPTSLSTNDYAIGRLRHWLNDPGNPGQPKPVLSLERAPSPDGSTPGQLVWYDYPNKSPGNNYVGSTVWPSLTAMVLPDGSTRFDQTIRNSFYWVTNDISTYTASDGNVALRTNLYTYYPNEIDLLVHVGPNHEQVVSNYVNNIYHQPDASYDALNQATIYLYNASRQLTQTTNAAGLTTTNSYFPSGTDVNRLSKTIDFEIFRTNSYTYTNALVRTHTDPRGSITTNVYDNLSRLTNSSDSRGTVKYIYTNLDLIQVIDRMGFTNSFTYDHVRRLIGKTNALGRATAYSYCTCGALDYILDAAGNYTRFYYDYAGRMTNAVYADNFSITNKFNSLGQITNTVDSSGYSITNWFNNQGLRYAISTAAGNQEYIDFDNEDRATNRIDAEGVSVAMTYDNLARLRTRKYPDNGVESFGYSARGLTAYTNQIGMTNFFVYDEGTRKIFETNANNELIRYTNNAAGDLLSLTDGKSQTTRWKYDQYGRVTNKLDQAGAEILRYAYDPDDRLTNRWSAAKGNTAYVYDPVGNLTNINYPVSADVALAYDALNRMTNMVDAAGTTKYTYTAAGQLLTEDGPFTSDTVTNAYSNRLRTKLNLQQPTGLWTNAFAYDSTKRLTNVTSPAGTFSYLYDPTIFTHQPDRIALPNTSYITNTFDTVARLKTTRLKNSGNSILDSYSYNYNTANQRTLVTRADNSGVAYTYDKIGQLTIADSSFDTEDRGYTYDSAWNLNWLTNNGSASQFTVDNKNQLTAAPVPVAASYDSNGNLTGQGVDLDTYAYDDENRLIDFNDTVRGFETVFVYDGLGRLRIRQEYQNAGSGPLAGGTLLSETHYIYDGWRVIQERNGTNNTPTVSYTRGTDLSANLEGAGGIGGLLARSSGYSSGNWTTNSSYFADGNGNITYMVDKNQSVVASYRYDPFGNTISSSGTLASANVYRFSSKEIHVNSGMYYYLYRFYDPNLQRWTNKDPIGEDSFRHSRRSHKTRLARLAGSDNLYLFARNAPTLWVDRSGLDIWVGHRSFGPFGMFDHWNINVGDPNGNYTSYSFQGGHPLDWWGDIYYDKPPTSFDSCRYLYTTPQQDKDAKNVLDQMVGDWMHYSLLNNTCHEFSCEMFDFFEGLFPDAELFFEERHFNPPSPPSRSHD